MRGHFRYLRFQTFPMTPRTPQCKVFWALLSSFEHSGVPEDSKSSLFPSFGLHPHTWPKQGCDKGIVSWKYLVVNYELVEKEKHINVNVQKRRFAFAKCIVSELLKDLIQNRKKQPLCEEDEIKLNKHNIHQKSCQCLYHIWKAEFV